MHALVGIFKMDTEQYARQRQGLEERIVPVIRHQPGFVSATWSYDRAEGRAFSLIVLETESAARKLASFVQEQAPRGLEAGVQLESITVTEVLAEARK